MIRVAAGSDKMNKECVSSEHFDLQHVSKDKTEKRSMRTGYTTGASAAASNECLFEITSFW